MRINKLRKKLSENGLFPFLVSDLKSIRYLTGFSGSYAYILVCEDKTFFISDSRYEEYARSILPPSVEFRLQKTDIYDSIKKLAKERGIGGLYLENHSVPLSVYGELKARIKGLKIRPGGDAVNEIRMQKDESEIGLLRKAAGITDLCMRHISGLIRPGVPEWDIAVEIEYFYRKNGCRKTSFDTIVASGKGSSMPHYETSMTKRIEHGDMVLIDMGCEYLGYNSDLTRTVFVGRIDPLFEKIYSIVLRAQASAIARTRPGVTTGVLDSVARGVISSEGYGDYFGHSLGHGLGLEVHELPAVKSGDFKLKKNMVITIEPGIYIPGSGGVRIEDMVLVTDRGCEVLTGADREIAIL